MPTPEKVSDSIVNIEIHRLIRLRHRAVAEVVLPTNQLRVELIAHFLPRRTQTGTQQIVNTPPKPF